MTNTNYNWTETQKEAIDAVAHMSLEEMVLFKKIVEEIYNNRLERERLAKLLARAK